VLQAAELDQDRLHIPVANPAGLRLGGALPEFIALSMLAEAHAVLKGANAQSISDLVKL
jgi:xanthine/CO dehydrogenase XdhC/CoxF family maturation factor